MLFFKPITLISKFTFDDGKVFTLCLTAYKIKNISEVIKKSKERNVKSISEVISIIKTQNVKYKFMENSEDNIEVDFLVFL